MTIADESKPIVFYAYPSDPPSAADAAATALADFDHTRLISVVPWDKLFINGRIIPAEVFTAIDSAMFLIADLTNLSPNVLYEVGYAIGRGKRIWLTADVSRTSREMIASSVPSLATLGTYAYENGHQIAAAFEKDYPALIESPPLIEQFRGVLSGPHTPAVLFMKSLYETDASVRVTDRIATGSVSPLIDDPAETNARSMSWYVERLLTSVGVLVHFTAADRTGAAALNARYALVSGMARGAGTRHLLLQEKSVKPVPLDFRDDVRMYGAGREARKIVDEWLVPIEQDQQQLVAKVAEDRDRFAQRATLQALHLGIGDFVAENDRNLISEYFIETAAYLDALQSTSAMVFVGRKGTGKTANLMKLAAELSRSAKHVVAVVKPAGYDIASLVGAIRDVGGDAVREGTMVGLWKYLLVTEIVAELCREYERRLEGRLPLTADELSLWEKADKQGWMESTFAERLERVVDSEGDIAAQVEILFREQVSPVVGQLAMVLRGKKRVCVLLDNLDKAWSRDADFPILSRFLLSLLVAAGELHGLLGRKMPQRLELSTVVFVRSDIFEHVKRAAREPDKLPATMMKWNDSELLMRVVDERFRAASQMPAPETWRRYFTADVRGKTTREYIVSRILPRPRDAIVFVKAAIASAVNRGHGVVTESDVLQAEQDYSTYALDSVKVENMPVAETMEEVLVQLMYGTSVVEASELQSKLDAGGVASQQRDEMIDLLVASSILGREVDDDHYEFAEDLPAARALALRGRKFGARRRLGSRFKVHVALHRILDIN